MTATLVSVNVGMPKDVPWNGKTVHTGVWKTPVEGAVMVRRLNIDGDGQGDLAGHGGEQRAVMVYQTESYDYWRDYLGRDDLQPGNFGENFTVSGLDDHDVCIGDRYRIGEAEFEVTQPRVTCFRVGMRLGVPEMPNLLVSHHRPGFYFRVITEGLVRAGDDIVLTRRGPPRTQRRRRRRAAVPARPRYGTAAQGRRRARAEPRLAAVVPRHARRSTKNPAPQHNFPLACRTGMARVPAATRHGHPPGEPDGAVDPARSRRWRRPSDAASRPVPHREDSRRRRSATDAQLLAVRGSRSGVLPHQRQTRGPRTGEPMAAQPCRQRIGHRIRLAARRFLPRRRQQPGHPGVCRHRRHPRHGHGARVGRGEEPAPDLVAAYDAEQRDACVRRRGHGPARTRCPTLISWSSTPVATTCQRASIGGRSPALGLPTDATAYLCGPTGFMDDMRDALTAAGIDPARIHSELFGALPPINPGVVGAPPPKRPHPPEGVPGSGPQVTFARSGLSVNWSPGFHTLLEFAEACDVPTRYSCRSGVCHTCATAVIEGTTDYNEPPLEEPADGAVLLCTATPAKRSRPGSLKGTQR